MGAGKRSSMFFGIGTNKSLRRSLEGTFWMYSRESELAAGGPSVTAAAIALKTVLAVLIRRLSYQYCSWGSLL